MPRLSIKPDASFFRKIATGAVGARKVCADLAGKGHDMVELERGSTDTKLWKEVKRKRVRLPDLLCIRCGLRLECRAKTKGELSMSHSPTEAERAWDFGMVDDDLVAFPITTVIDDDYWSVGRLEDGSSYWHERNWLRWTSAEHVNYFRVKDFRDVAASGFSTKGVTEGSETSITWSAIFSTMTGEVVSVVGGKVKVRPVVPNGRPYTWQNRNGIPVVVSAGEMVEKTQIIASAVPPVVGGDLKCPGVLSEDHISKLLRSRQRTQRFTGVKLARLREERDYADAICDIVQDDEEDVYVRLEGAAYLASVHDEPARALFTGYLFGSDPQNQLEAAITLSETATEEAVDLLSEVLDDASAPFFLRSAAAWSLSQIGGDAAVERLVRAFSDVDIEIREDALEGITNLGEEALPALTDGVAEEDLDIAAGCAEAVRQQVPLPDHILARLMEHLEKDSDPTWVVWLLGHIPRDYVASSIAGVQESQPHLHYAISVLWSFVDSWIARRWELDPRGRQPEGEV